MIPVKLWYKYLFKYNKEQKEACKKYYKMMSYWNKELNRVTKNFRPWNSDALLDVLQVMLRYYKDYFVQDYNVHQSKEDTKYTRAVNSLTECCLRVEELLNEDPFEKMADYKKEIFGTPVREVHEDGSITLEYPNETAEKTKLVKDYIKSLNKEREKKKLDLFMTIAKNYEYWWD